MKNLLRFLVYAPALFTIMVGAQTSVSQEKGIGSRESFNRGGSSRASVRCRTDERRRSRQGWRSQTSMMQRGAA
jgi:hypothetical protein